MRVSIIGAGISGTMLALRLQQLGVETTLYAEHTPDEIRKGRLLNTVARFDHTLQREAALGVDYWTENAHAIRCIEFRAGPPLSLSFLARPDEPFQSVDFRVLLPRWIEEYAARGGKVVVAAAPATVSEVEGLVAGHDMAVVSVGRASIPALFPVDTARSPYREPQRLVFAGLFDGLARPEHQAVSFNLAPGIGEIFQMPILSAGGLSTSILVDAVPGGPLASLVTGPVADRQFISALLDALEAHAPAVFDRVERVRFALRDPQDWLRGALTPAVRQAYTTLPSGTLALAIGDAWITNDPLAAQGANLGSHSAWVAAEAIARAPACDASLGARIEAAMWQSAGPVTAFSNALLEPPAAHVLRLMRAAASDQVVADAFASGFADPVALAGLFADPAAVDRLISGATEQPSGPTQRIPQ